MIRLSVLAIVGAMILAAPQAARAQAELVSAAPGPGAILETPPAQVRLVFNSPLLERGTSIAVSTESGEQIDLRDGRIDPHDPFALIVTLPLLYEGKYSVSYSATLLGSSVTLADRYLFTIDLPDPVVDLKSPLNGQSFTSGSVPIRLRTRFVDFSTYNRRIRVYVDGALYTELRGLRTTIEGLSPGVHEIRTVLVRLNDQESPETSTTVTIAIARPDDRPRSIAQYEVGPELTLSVVVGLLLVTTLLLGIGLWLGRLAE